MLETRKEFSDIKTDHIMQSFGVCLKMGAAKKKRKASWLSPLGAFNFNVDGASRGKPGLASIGGVLRNHKGEVLYMFSKHVGIKDSNEMEVLTILEAPCIYHSFYHHNLIMESDSINAISWVKSLRGPWKMHFLFNEIGLFVSEMQLTFQHIIRSANGMEDSLVKQGVN